MWVLLLGASVITAATVGLTAPRSRRHIATPERVPQCRAGTTALFARGLSEDWRVRVSSLILRITVSGRARGTFSARPFSMCE